MSIILTWVRVLLFVFSRVLIALSVLLRFMASDDPFGIFKLFLFININFMIIQIIFPEPVNILYGCELWGLSNCDIIERVHLKYCKLLLSLKSSTPNCMIYGELGRYPLYIDIKQRMVSYWIKLITGKQSKFALLYIV